MSTNNTNSNFEGIDINSLEDVSIDSPDKTTTQVLETKEKEDKSDITADVSVKTDNNSITTQAATTKDDEPSVENEGDYLLGENGNVIDKDGNIIIAKDDIEYNEDGDIIIPDTPLIDVLKESLKTNLNFDLVDKSFEDTNEGFVNLVQEVTKLAIAKEKDEFAKSNPRIAAYQQHLAAGGTDESFFSVGSKWRSYELPKDNSDTDSSNNIRKQVITENYLTRFGYYDTNDKNTQAEILVNARDYAEMVESSGKLINKSKEALKDLQLVENTAEQQRDFNNQKVLQQQQQETNKYWNNVTNVVTNGDLKGLTIPKDDRQAFLDYVSKDVTGKGETQEMLDRAKEDLALTLQLAFMRYKGFDLNALVKLQVQKDKVISLRKRKATAIKVTKNRKTNTKTSKGIEGVSINSIL